MWNKRSIRYFLCAAAACLAVIIPCMTDKLYYLISDDYLMNSISMGEYGNDAAPFLVFSNALLGVILRFFYNVFPSVNWFPVLQLATVAIAFAIINISLNGLCFRSAEILLSTTLMEIVVVYHLTFTVTSYVAIGAGCVCFLCNCFARQKKGMAGVSKSAAAVFILSLLWGDFWRQDALLTGVFLFVPLFVFLLRKNRRMLWALLLAAVVIGAGRGGDALMYRADDARWEYFHEFKTARSEVLDYRIINYFEYEDMYKEIGFSYNDYLCLYSWTFADQEVFSREHLETIASAQKLNQRFDFDVIGIVKSMLESKYNYWLLAVLLISLVLCGKKPWMNIVIALCTYALIAALYVRGRVVMRVFLPIYILGMLSIIVWTYAHYRKWNSRLWNGVIFAAIMVGQICVVCHSVSLIREVNMSYFFANIKRFMAYQEMKDYINESEDILFAGGSSTAAYLTYSNDIFSVGESMSASRIVKLGGWDMYSPSYYRQLEAYGVKNPDRLLLELAENENIQFVTGSEQEVEMILSYINEHSGKTAEYKTVKEFEGTTLKIVKFFYH